MRLSNARYLLAIVILSIGLTGAQAGSIEIVQAALREAKNQLVPNDMRVSSNVRLPTKCGIRFLEYDHLLWEADTPLGDGKPPPGWPSPAVVGFAYPHLDQLRFVSSYEPNSITYHRSDQTWPPCP